MTAQRRGGSSSRARARRPGLVARAAAVWRVVSARPGVAHLIRAWDRSQDRMASQLAAAITYFSFLSLVPILMVAFSVAGLVLGSQPDLLASLKDSITGLMPSRQLGASIGGLIDEAVGQSLTVGIIGLVIALYSGLNWMGNVRDAVRAQWRPRWGKKPEPLHGVVMQYVWDLASLVGLLVAIGVSFSLTALGTAAQDAVLHWVGAPEGGVLDVLTRIGPFALAIVASTVTFGWVYTMLPERKYRAARRTLVIGSVAMAAVFEILKAALTLLVTRMTSSPSGKAFGAIIGLLVFFNVVARAFLMMAAWMATAERGPDGHSTSGPAPR